MSEPRFTPGPWHVYDSMKESDDCLVLDANNEYVADICYNENAEANAHLIAAAPSFYEDEEKKLVFLRTLKNSILPAIRKLPGLYFEVSEMLNVSVQSIDIIIRETEELLAEARGEVRE